MMVNLGFVFPFPTSSHNPGHSRVTTNRVSSALCCCPFAKAFRQPSFVLAAPSYAARYDSSQSARVWRSLRNIRGDWAKLVRRRTISICPAIRNRGPVSMLLQQAFGGTSLPQVLLRAATAILSTLFVTAAYLLHVFCFSEKSVPEKFLPELLRKFLTARKAKIQLSDVAALVTIVILSVYSYVAKRARKSAQAGAGEEKKEADRFSLEKYLTPPWQVSKKSKDDIRRAYVFLPIAFMAISLAYSWFDIQLLGMWAWPAPPKDLRASLFVLIPHLSWVASAVSILQNILKPFFPPVGKWMRMPFFDYPDSTSNAAAVGAASSDSAADAALTQESEDRKADEERGPWWMWAVAGFYISSLIYNVACILSGSAAEALDPLEGANPDVNDLKAVIQARVRKVILKDQPGVIGALAAIGPCVTGPVIEEYLYRGFLMPALTVVPGVNTFWSIFISSMIFGFSHFSTSKGLAQLTQLSILGLLWAFIYVRCRNLWTPILMHLFWNNEVNRYFLKRLLPEHFRLFLSSLISLP